MADLVIKIIYETLENLFSGSDTDFKFNCLLYTYLRIFHLSLPLMRIKSGTENKIWITIGIKTSYKHETELCLADRNSNDLRLNAINKMYHKILSNVIKEAKRNTYSNQILESNNKIKIL